MEEEGDFGGKGIELLLVSLFRVSDTCTLPDSNREGSGASP